MKVNELNEGEKAAYNLTENILKIEINGQSLEIDLAAEQKKEKRTIDICLNKKGEIVREVNNWYIANIHIPAIKYELQDTGEIDEQGNAVYEKVKKPLNTDEVIVDLWELPNFILNQNEEEGVVN